MNPITAPNNNLLISTGLGAVLGQFVDGWLQSKGFPVPPGTFSSIITGAVYWLSGRGRK